MKLKTTIFEAKNRSRNRFRASFPHLVTLGLVLDVAAASDDPLVTSNWNKIINL
jgi:hypothetical protein